MIRKGSVEGVVVKDIWLDTGCSRTLVRRELVKPEKLVEGKLVEIQCAHGDTAPYPVAEVKLSVAGRKIIVEAAVSDTLPQSVLLGVDVPELEDVMMERKKEDGKAFIATTRRMAEERAARGRRTKEEESEISTNDLMKEESENNVSENNG